MFFKKKCSTCGAKNLKERTTCSECGAPLDLGRVDSRLTEVRPEGKPNLASTMRQSTGWKRRVWFWVGVTLLSISALIWLICILAMIDEGGDTGWYILTGVLLTGIPIGIGIYCVRRGRKALPIG